MSPTILERLTPRAFPRTRLLTAALVWSAVGCFLTAKGLWLSRDMSVLAITAAGSGGAGLGMIKSRLVFDRVAEKIIVHIGNRPRRACLGGLFSVKNWALILVMALFGRILGALPVDAALKTGIYVMVGSGLACSSRLMWKAWKSPALTELSRI